MIIVLGRLGIQKTQLNIVDRKSTTNINPNREKLKECPLKSRIRQESPLTPDLFIMVPEYLAKIIRQLKEIK